MALSTPSDGRGADAVVIIVVALTAVLLHVGQLGFYSDDWMIPGGGTTSEDQSLVGIMRATGTPDTPMRPLNLLVLSLVYWLFGANPLPFHIVNTGYLAAMGVGFYVLLRELWLSRPLSFAIAALFVVMPHYSATRFWIVAHPINLSMALYFFGVFAALKAMAAHGFARIAPWAAAGALAMAGSLLAYEQVLPLAAATPLLVWWHGRRLSGWSRPLRPHQRLPVILVATALVLVPVVLYKMGHTERFNPTSLRGQLDWAIWYFRVALRDAYVEFGLKLPLVVWRSLRDHWSAGAAALAAGAAGLTYFHLRRMPRDTADPLASTGLAALLLVAGGALFAAGFGLVVVTTMPVTSPTGSNNRLAIAAAAGVASTIVAVMAWICGRLPGAAGRLNAFAAAMALLIGANTLVVSTLASFWAEAAQTQFRLLDDIQAQFPDGPPGRTFLLDGICPYIGPGTVFNSNWDLQQALVWTYRADERDADVVTADTEVKADGIHTSMFGGFIRHTYPYADDLYVYRPQQRLLQQLSTYDAAVQYFGGPGRDWHNRCPPGDAGIGAAVLGIPVER